MEVELHSYLTTLTLPLPIDVVDTFEWKAADLPLNVFNSQATWEVLHPRQPIQTWHDIVWFKGALPKHAFTMWVTNYDRLPTRARMASWGLAVPVACHYANDVWSQVFRRCSHPQQRITDWAELLSWIQATQSPRNLLLRKLVSQAVVFHVWKQRNNLLHNGIPLPPAHVFKALDREVRNIISARRSNKLFKSLMVLWFQ
ncbi:uncharacterized protein LOC108808185 [Raphanus sativus]|uniref:Uncharacterized protein LOC108808185 n=1 Tax=Raphanus sativus TaxID=3726 RepID=A0A6J0JJP6_RAPSA|nr:uncharacterized protein LOC108808185 [Raphanus sativus]